MFSNFVKLCALTSVTLTCLGTASAQTACDSTQTACDSESDDSGDGDPVEYDEDEATDSGGDDLSDADAVAGYGDVSRDNYFAEAVQWSADYSVTNIPGSCFGPDLPVSRGETAVWIWNMSIRPQPSSSHSFGDVADETQSDAVSWMSETGITTGTSSTTFSPDSTLTRGQVSAFLWRLADRPAAAPHGFTDVTASWQEGPVSWMAETGITTGTTSSTFSPDIPLTRAHLVTFLYRYSGSPAVTLDQDYSECNP